LLIRKAWSNALQNVIGKWQMLCQDIVSGFLIAGMIAVFVMREWRTGLFGFGEGTSFAFFLSALIGGFIGVVTFICSVNSVSFDRML